MKRASGDGLFWILVVIVIIIAIIAQCTSNSAGMSRSEEARFALDMVQTMGKRSTIADSISSQVDTRDEVVGWTSARKRSDRYEVMFTVVDDGREVVYEWEADVGDGSVRAMNRNANEVMQMTKKRIR